MLSCQPTYLPWVKKQVFLEIWCKQPSDDRVLQAKTFIYHWSIILICIRRFLFSIIKIVYTEDRWDLMTICTVRKASSKGKIVYPWYIVTEFVLCERPAQNEELSTLDTLLQNLYCVKGQLKMKNCLPLIHCYRICTVRKTNSKWRIIYPSGVKKSWTTSLAQG